MLSVHHTRPKKKNPLDKIGPPLVVRWGETKLIFRSYLLLFHPDQRIIDQATLSNRTLVYFGHHPGRLLLLQWFPLGTPQVPSIAGLEMAWSLMKQCSLTLDIAQLARWPGSLLVGPCCSSPNWDSLSNGFIRTAAFSTVIWVPTSVKQVFLWSIVRSELPLTLQVFSTSTKLENNCL